VVELVEPLVMLAVLVVGEPMAVRLEVLVTRHQLRQVRVIMVVRVDHNRERTEVAAAAVPVLLAVRVQPLLAVTVAQVQHHLFLAQALLMRVAVAVERSAHLLAIPVEQVRVGAVMERSLQQTEAALVLTELREQLIQVVAVAVVVIIVIGLGRPVVPG
jgi:hypothetical protein